MALRLCARKVLALNYQVGLFVFYLLVLPLRDPV